MTNDLINSAFQFGGAIATWANVFKLLKDREIRGVSWWLWIFFSAWGVWNLYYFPSLDQWASFVSGIFLCAGNIVWVSLAIKFRKR